MEADKNVLESPDTAVESKIDNAEKEKHHHKSKKRKHRRRREQPNFDIPGVHKLVLSELTQKIIGCVAGENVTAEKPWMYVDKELLQDNIELHSESSELLPLKDQILEFSGPEVLLGYVPDESRDCDEFYLCLTVTATDTVKNIIERMQRDQDERLQNAINKKVGRWKSRGSEQEVDDNIIRNNRALIEVEVESKYPILPFKIQFRERRVQDMRDGYMELRPGDDSIINVIKKRIDTFSQISPGIETNEAQTICTYPSNYATQYEYFISDISATLDGIYKNFQENYHDNNHEIFDWLHVNSSINLYSDDYKNLVINRRFTVKSDIPHPIEYLTFINMELCEGKKISSVAWHPTLSGLVTLSYVDIAPTGYIEGKITNDQVLRAVHGANPVLFWSFLDDLYPKLIMETPREIYSLNFCPFRPNLLIGGCINGQIILWDITNKLEKVEEEEILTNDQQRYRAYMRSLMNWMKNIHDLALVRPTVISDLKFSHKGCVNFIRWMSPKHKITKTGKIEELPDDEESLQLLTSGEDGTILIWDLLMKPNIAPGGFKPTRRLNRLKKRPSALLAVTSPFSILHLNLRPIYCIKFNHPLHQRPISISTFYDQYFSVNFELTDTSGKLPSNLTTRKTFKIKSIIPRDPIVPELFIGTMDGDFLQGYWEGQEFDAGGLINFEECKYVNFSKYHDGPIVSTVYSDPLDAILTTGGKIFAIWRKEFKDRPVLWRKSNDNYTQGVWHFFDSCRVELVRSDGYLEYWEIPYKSNSPTFTMLSSNGPLTGLSTHPRTLKHNVFGFCDHRGSFRLFYLPHHPLEQNKTIQTDMRNFLDKEVQRKKDFLAWQETWNKKYINFVEVPEVIIEKSAVAEEKREAEEPTKEIKDTKKDKKKTGQRYSDWVQQAQAAKDQERIKKTILEKKQLDTEELIKQRMPLTKLEQEREIKRKKQKQILRKADKIFRDTVAMLFPEVIKEKPTPPIDPYAGNDEFEIQKDCFSYFRTISKSAQDMVDRNPFKYEFDWTRVLQEGKLRRTRLDDSYNIAKHRERYETYKSLKNPQRLSRIDENILPQEKHQSDEESSGDVPETDQEED